MLSHALVSACLSVKLYYALAVPAAVLQGRHSSCARNSPRLSDKKEVQWTACLRQVVESLPEIV